MKLVINKLDEYYLKTILGPHSGKSRAGSTASTPLKPLKRTWIKQSNKLAITRKAEETPEIEPGSNWEQCRAVGSMLRV